MDMTLTRTLYRQDGVLGTLLSDNGGLSFKCATLEHAYPENSHAFRPKIPIGFYKCVRGKHKLAHGIPFDTFEILKVLNHTGILFHVGNFNNDSDGCVLLGEETEVKSGQPLMIANSKKTFQRFMDLQFGIKSFNLTVLDYNFTETQVA